MRLILSSFIMMVGFWVFAQGEVTSKEVIIEKDKKIVLPRAEKLTPGLEATEVKRDTVRLRFSRLQPNFNISPYASNLGPSAFPRDAWKLPYQNYVKAGYGNYGSPLLGMYYGQEKKEFIWGAWFHHESSATGAVRKKESGTGRTYADFFGTLRSDKWSITPSLAWQLDTYKFYGREENDDIADDSKYNLNAIRFGADVTSIGKSNLKLDFRPVYRSTGQRGGGNILNKEGYFDISSSASYKIDSTFRVGADVQAGIIKFESDNSINRNFTRVSPWVSFTKDKITIKAGVQVAASNDTIVSGTSSYFYPDMMVEWGGLPGWTVYGKVDGELRPVTFSSLSQENFFLDDSLTMAHENVKMRISGGIRGAITSKVFVHTGVSVSRIQYMSFFVPAAYDTSRFVTAVDTETNSVFNWFGMLSWQPSGQTEFSVRTDVTGFTINGFDEAWYRPTFQLTMSVYQQIAERIGVRVNLVSLSGIRAPKPVTYEMVKLDPIFDLGITGQYKVNDRIGAFVEMQNLFSQNYQRYLNYPMRGAMIRVGAMYRF
jgi:hypothetical protein